MGIEIAEVTFKGNAPSLICISDKITELSQLPLLVESVAAADLETYTNLYELDAHLSFKAVPGNRLHIYAYRSDAISELDLSHAEEFEEPVDTQAVHLEMYIGQEPTLFYLTIFALEALGGISTHPLPAGVRQAYLKITTLACIKQRSLKISSLSLLYWIIGLVLLPIFLPIWLFQYLWFHIRLSDIARGIQRHLD